MWRKKLSRPKRGSICRAFFLFVLLWGTFLWADNGRPSIASFASNGFPDNADLRGRLFSYVIGATRDTALAYGEKQLQSAAGQVTVRVEKRDADFIVEFVNASATSPGQPGRGSCYIQRSNAKGNYILQARILLEDDPTCFLTLYPSGSGTRGDIVMYGAAIKRGLYFSDMLYRILLLNFSDIVDATKNSFDWGLVFKFGPRGSDGNAAQLREALASVAAEPSPTAALAPALASSSPNAMGGGATKLSFAAAPALPAPDGLDAVPAGPRPLRIAMAVDRASSADALLLDLSASGETSARELALLSDASQGFVDGRLDPALRPSYVDFPRYDKGIDVAALRAAVFLDLQANPLSMYALIGEGGMRATLIPSFDEAGRLGFAAFSGGKETSLDELFASARDARLRVIRIPS
jgi:hypothetical protein